MSGMNRARASDGSHTGTFAGGRPSGCQPRHRRQRRGGWDRRAVRAPAQSQRPSGTPTTSGWRSDHEIVQVALAYINAAHDSRSPIRDLARTSKLDERYIRETVAEARRRGLLTSPGASRPGGVLTEKGRAAVEAAPE